MNWKRARLAQFVLVAAAGSQAGHLLAYRARFGASAAVVQTTGAHAYFAPLAATLLGGLGAALLLAALLIGWIRFSAARRGALPRRDRWPLMDVLPLLFVSQLVIYFGQESLEGLAAGMHGPVLLDLLLWGAVGQLPIAFLGAIALSWLSVRVEQAVGVLDFILSELRWPQPRPVQLLATAPHFSLAHLLARDSGASFTKRGPPLTS